MRRWDSRSSPRGLRSSCASANPSRPACRNTPDRHAPTPASLVHTVRGVAGVLVVVASLLLAGCRPADAVTQLVGFHSGSVGHDAWPTIVAGCTTTYSARLRNNC